MNNHLITSSQGVVSLKFQWIPGHVDFTPNEKVDKEAKRAAKGQLSTSTLLPKPLKKDLPHSILALRQHQKAKIQKRWLCHWKASPRYLNQRSIDRTMPSKKWLQLMADLTCTQAMIILQLCTGHIGLNKHLHRIKCTNSPACPSCNTMPHETIQHFLFECNNYCHKCFELQRKLGCNVSKLPYLLTNSAAIKQTLKYVHSMHHFNQTFSSLASAE